MEEVIARPSPQQSSTSSRTQREMDAWIRRIRNRQTQPAHIRFEASLPSFLSRKDING
jgi:hypothetical protein